MICASTYREALAIRPLPKPSADQIAIAEIRRAVKRWLIVARNRIPESAVRDAVLAGQPALIAGRPVWREAWTEIEEEWESAALKALRKSGAKEIEKLGFDLGFDVDNPYAQKWAAKHSGELIRGVTRETEKAVAKLVHAGLVDGIPPLDTGRALRPLIGLTERHAIAVRSQLENLIDQGATAEQAMAASEKYSTRLLNHRAEMIARTETTAAQAAGLDSAWKTARDGGLVTAGAKRRWISAKGSARTCEICEGLHGQEVGLDEPWHSDIIGDVERPPAHPGCRCSAGLRQ